MSKMSKLFDQDNMFFAIMGVLFDLIILNVLTLLCCLPIVTAGASFTAMHSVLWRMVRHEETYVARQFFDSFKRNLKQSLLPWLAFLLAAIVLGFSRAFGETLAVLMVVGNVAQTPHSIFDSAYTLPALIANNYGEMMSIPLYESALMGAALLLLLVVAFFNIVARAVIVRVGGAHA